MARQLHLFAFALAFLMSSCGEHREHRDLGYSLGLYHSKSNESLQSTEVAFHSWLIAHGLTQSSSPGGVAAWSGVHSAGEQSSWYALPVGHDKVLLRISTSAEAKYINASTFYDGVFTSAQLSKMRQRNQQLWFDIISWFRAC